MRVFLRTVLISLSAACFFGPIIAGQTDVFSTGAIRLIPEVTISDEALSGGEYFGGIVDLAMDDLGCLYACDVKAKNVKKFDAAGKFLQVIGKGGQGPGEFNYPMEIEIHGPRLFVRDAMTSRISIFDLEGKYLSSAPVDRNQGGWWRFRALPDGRFIVESELIDRTNPDMPQEMQLSLYSSEFAYVKTIYRKSIFRNKFITEPIRTNVPFPYPALVAWSLTPDGKIAVGFSGTYEIQIVDPDKGKLHSWTHPFAPVEVTSRDQKAWFDGLTGATSSGSGAGERSKGAPDYIIDNTVFPKTKPAFEKFLVDGSGRIWAFLFSADPRAKPLVELFDREGKFLGRAALEGEFPNPVSVVAYPGGFWMMATDADGEARIVKARIGE